MHYALMGVGGLIFVIGIGLFFGNRSGMFVTIPFAGYITMAIGGAIAGAGYKKMQALKEGGGE